MKPSAPSWVQFAPRDVAHLAIVRRREGRLTRALSIGAAPAHRVVNAATAEGHRGVVVPVRLVPVDGRTLDDVETAVPAVDTSFEPRPVTSRTQARRRRRLDRLDRLEPVVGPVVDLSGFDRVVELDGDEDLDDEADHRGGAS